MYQAIVTTLRVTLLSGILMVGVSADDIEPIANQGVHEISLNELASTGIEFSNYSRDKDLLLNEVRIIIDPKLFTMINKEKIRIGVSVVKSKKQTVFSNVKLLYKQNHFLLGFGYSLEVSLTPEIPFRNLMPGVTYISYYNPNPQPDGI